MHIILTHEQADFDAVASVLGAYLLDPLALPVMPRRCNRNVRQFLTHYRNELPFIETSALPQEKIESVTLVDTQSLVTLKGMNKDTSVHVIDHHAIRTNLASEWTVSTHKLGACTTLFVENLHANHIHLGITQATLLLMGVYEDTGSLSYVRTTSRDIHAAAYLVEHGASLSLASQYMNPPLSEEQNRLYDLLITKAENLVIAGKKIIITSASALEMEDEVSSVTHKLRDFLDPAALFMLVNTSEGVRVVARSTTDQINVASLLGNFGGGGHERAASALIQVENRKTDPDGSETLKRIHDELIRILPRYILPDITVGQIMSPDPLTLSPETKAHEAALLMRKYGYEGYPVIENQMVVGLLTRRAVDRAVAHKLNLPIRSLMEAGKVTVHPDDSLDDLQRVMTSSDWGQIPVVNPDTGRVVGIVTRTDLIKTLGTSSYTPARENLARDLEKALPPARLFLLQAIADVAHQRENAAYIVGGFVRDLILGRPSQDFDIVIEGNAIDIAFDLCKKYGGRVTSHKRFGTAKWRISEVRDKLMAGLIKTDTMPGELPESLDLISARTEFYDYPSALPTVENSSIKLDLHRRDFSINTMAMRLDGQHYGELYDYWGGLNDLKNRLVRVLHSLSFVDDPTRMLRAVRFEQRFNFKIENRTQQLMDEARPLLRQLSPDRLRHEINLIFLETCPSAILNRLQQLGLLNAIHPDLHFPEIVSSNLENWISSHPEPFWDIAATGGNKNSLRWEIGYLAWFFYLDEQHTLDICHRLRLPAHMQKTLNDLYAMKRLPLPAENPQPSQIVEILEGFCSLSLYIASLVDFPPEIKTLIIRYMQKWKLIKATIDGFTLQQYGIKPGPNYRSILRTLKYAWLDGLITNQTEEKELLGRLIGSMTESKSL